MLRNDKHEQHLWILNATDTVITRRRAAENETFAEFNEIADEINTSKAEREAQIDSLVKNSVNYAPNALTKTEVRRIIGRLIAKEGTQTDSKGRTYTRVEYGNGGVLRVTLNSAGTAVGIISEGSSSDGGSDG